MKELDYKILVRYLSSHCTAEERSAIKQWANNSASNKRQLKKYQSLWDKAAMETKPDKKDFDAKRGWQVFQKKIEEENLNISKRDTQSTSYYKTKHNDFKYRFAAVAAVFLAVMLTGYFAYTHWNQTGVKQPAPQMQKIVTSKGQRTHITLSDGTNILLNADSKLRVPNVFKTDIRRVYLQGQAYFEVTENSDKPFVIYVDGTIVRVLGTAFSVRAYPEDHQIRVVVKQGRVRFEANNEPKASSAVITANELVQFNEQHNKLITKKIEELSLYLGWINGSLNFKKTSMTEVATDLERRYGVEVIFKDPEIKSMVLTAHLKSKMIQNVLDVIAMSLKIDYKLMNNRVVFFKPKNHNGAKGAIDY